MKKNAFTLIETLVAIVIFGIGILVVLFGISKTLRNQDYASTQINSSFLAREWMELVFNLRDANYHKELLWNCVFTSWWGNITIWNWITDSDDDGIVIDEITSDVNNPYCQWYFEPWMILKIWIWTWDEYIHVEKSELVWDFETDFTNHQIFLHTWDTNNTFIYNHTWADTEKTRFARYLLITWVVENGELISTGDLLKVEAHVLYKRWELTWEKVMETFMWNYDFN